MSTARDGARRIQDKHGRDLLPLMLPGERRTCPICERPNVRLVTSGLELVRVYRCADCGARWGINGRQDELDLGETRQEVLPID